jgi:hypothetical protein
MKTSIKSTMLFIGVLIVSLLFLNVTAGATGGKMAGGDMTPAVEKMKAEKMIMKEEPKVEAEELEIDELEEIEGLVDIDVHQLLKDKKAEKEER